MKLEDAISIKLGDDTVIAVYINDQQVWPVGDPPPVELDPIVNVFTDSGFWVKPRAAGYDKVAVLTVGAGGGGGIGY